MVVWEVEMGGLLIKDVSWVFHCNNIYMFVLFLIYDLWFATN